MKRRDFFKAVSLPIFSVLAKSIGKSLNLNSSKNYIWISLNEHPRKTWKNKLSRLKKKGIIGLLVQCEEKDLKLVNKFVSLAKDFDFEVHFWMITMKRDKEELIEKHPEWYAVSRRGISCLENPPYRKDYRWLCPSRKSVKNYVQNRCKKILNETEVDGIHLDYIRYPDVKLPEAIQEEYGLVQDKEYPRFDYCYCEVCRENFKNKYGQDPLKMDKPSKNKKWKEYRYNTITEVVKGAEKVVHGYNKKLTAAVFPTPEIAKNLVRQDWTSWPLDAVYPMMYHNFYNQPVSWIKEACKQGGKAINDRIPLYAGIFIPELTPEELVGAGEYANKGGAKGISLFDFNAMSGNHWDKFNSE